LTWSSLLTPFVFFLTYTTVLFSGNATSEESLDLSDHFDVSHSKSLCGSGFLRAEDVQLGPTPCNSLLSKILVGCVRASVLAASLAHFLFFR
jgi:hypothetical protein